MTRPPDFDAMYTADDDPWQVATSWYERRKLAVLMASLPRERYSTAWEPGCGIGVATLALAGRVDDVVASDVSPRAVALAQQRLEHTPGVRVVRSALPERPFDGTVELVVAAETLYYLPDLETASTTLWQACAPGSHLVAMHWAHHPHDAYRSGPDTQAALVEHARRRGAAHLVEHHDDDFRLDVLEVPG